MPSKILRSLGFTEKEVAIYLALLPLGTTGATTLATRTGLARSTIHHTCQKMGQKGLLWIGENEGRHQFTPHPPEKFIDLLNLKLQEVQDKRAQVQPLVEALNAQLKSQPSLPRVRFFQGEKDLQLYHQQILEEGTVLRSFEGSCLRSSSFSDFSLQKEERRISHRIITAHGFPKDFKTFPNTEIKHLKDPFRFDCHLDILPECVGISLVAHTPPISLLIYSRDVARNFRLIFDHLWNQNPT